MIKTQIEVDEGLEDELGSVLTIVDEVEVFLTWNNSQVSSYNFY